MIIYIPIDVEMPKEQNGAYCNFLQQTVAKLWPFLASSVSEKDEDKFLLFLYHSLRIAGFIRLV